MRTNTNINSGAASIGLAAVELAKREIDLSAASAMVIGAGENAELVAKYLLKAEVAGLIIAMAIIRRSCHLEAYLKPIHFNNLGLLLLTMSLLWFYFTFTEYLTSFYGAEPAHMAVFYAKLTGSYAPYFWTMVVCCFIIPMAILCYRKTRTIKGTVIVSIAVIIGMWLERFTIVLPTLVNPRLPYERGVYMPTWVEFAVTFACVAAFILLYMLFVKVFPIVSIWEIKEGKEHGVEETAKRVESYLPESIRDL